MAIFKVVMERVVIQVCETLVRDTENEAEALKVALENVEDSLFWADLDVLHLEAVDSCECEWVPVDEIDFDDLVEIAD
jgi:hypothetical protein